MKIKSQLRLFLVGVVLVPLLCIVTIPEQYYFSKSRRILQEGWEQLQKIKQLPPEKDNLEKLRKICKKLPSHIDYLVLIDQNKIFFNTIKEFENLQTVQTDDLFNFIESTSGNFSYQIISPSSDEDEHKIIVITRSPRNPQNYKKNKTNKFLLILTIFTIFFEIFCILEIIFISRTISKSITVLEKNTKKISSGELNTELKLETNFKNTNEITNLTKYLEKMRLALLDSEQRRAKLIMGISHDLRTPISVIKGYTEAISDGLCKNKEELANTTNIILNKTDQLETMINTLINFVKINQDEWIQNLKKQKIFPVLQNFTKNAITTGEIFHRKVTASLEIDENTVVAFDTMLFQRAFENIFTNAIRYTKENDLISIKAIQEPGKIILSISDTGIGMTEEDKNRIFDMFYRASNSRQDGGMGIGLAVVKTIIISHGWKINVDSEVGKGAIFSIIINIQETC